MSRVVLALSGGVDSSMAGYLLKQAGHEVIGVFILHVPASKKGLGPFERIGSTGDLRVEDEKSIQKDSNPFLFVEAAEAQKVAYGLGIQFEVLDLQHEFQPVIDYFVDEYAAGRTPNPCIFCNALIKFGKLYEYAESIGAEHLATGHYAHILNPGTSQARLCRGCDPDKDQSYFLYNIERGILPKLIFPVGKYTKAEIRSMATDLDLHAAEKPDSQDICFVAKEEHAAYVRRILTERAAQEVIGDIITERSGEIVNPKRTNLFSYMNDPDPLSRSGPIVTVDGREVGRHQGIENFTVGQRKGIGVALGEPHYVIRIEAEGRRVIVGTRDQLARRELTVKSANWLVDPPGERFRAEVKIRYSTPAVAAEIEILDSDRFRVVFDKPCFGVAPGQGAVCYDGDVVLGGGWIE
ncbi:MAG: tRNA 2-thiouridine(34) synthase MnmA [Pirellulales bacterium]|nr:tRNA 2-thiouridine(34) synthase MnmA [Pirellulales bacterium]